MSQSTPRAWGRTTVILTCALVIAVLFGLVLGNSWRDQRHAADLAKREQLGVAYLHPLTGLIGQLVQTQTAAVRGDQIDVGKLRKAVSGVDALDQTNGVPLSASQRYQDLRGKIESAIPSDGTPRERYQTWSDVVALALDLVRAVGDNASLSHDQDDDSFYVAQAALIQLPDAMVQAGRAADLATLAGTQMLAGDDAQRAAVARYAVATDGEDVTNGLNKSISATLSHTLGGSIALPLDAFRSAVATFTPPTAVTQTAPATANELVEGSKAIFNSALPLAHALLTQLNNLLKARDARLANTRRDQLVAGGAALAAYLIAVLVFTVGRRRRRHGAPDALTTVTTADPVRREPALIGTRNPPNHRGDY